MLNSVVVVVFVVDHQLLCASLVAAAAGAV
jgi:hypothetical protein